MCHNTEEWRKTCAWIWRILIHLLKVSKICVLMGPFWLKYLMFELIEELPEEMVEMSEEKLSEEL